MPSTMASACSTGNSSTSRFFIWRTIERRSSPCTCSIAMKKLPSTWPTSNVWQMFGCESVAAMRASWSNMSMKAVSWLTAGKMRLMTMSFSKPATLRWIARKSSAMPPCASFRSSVYFPNRAGIPLVASSSATSPTAGTCDMGGAARLVPEGALGIDSRGPGGADAGALGTRAGTEERDMSPRAGETVHAMARRKQAFLTLVRAPFVVKSPTLGSARSRGPFRRPPRASGWCTVRSERPCGTFAPLGASEG